MADLTPIEDHLRAGEDVDPDAHLVIRGWPLTVDGLLTNADATRRRYSRAGRPFEAISAEVTIAGWDVDAILAGPRLRTRRSYASAPVRRLTGAGLELLATFGAPHYSVILPSYTSERAERLLELLGEPKVNPHHIRRQQ